MGQQKSKAKLPVINGYGHDDKIFGAFPCLYLGNCTVELSHSSRATLEAAERILSLKQPKKKVTVTVSRCKIDINSLKNSSLQISATLSHVMLASVLGKQHQLIAFLFCDTVTTCTCHLLHSRKYAIRLSSAVEDAFDEIHCDMPVLKDPSKVSKGAWEDTKTDNAQVHGYNSKNTMQPRQNHRTLDHDGRKQVKQQTRLIFQDDVTLNQSSVDHLRDETNLEEKELTSKQTSLQKITATERLSQANVSDGQQHVDSVTEISSAQTEIVALHEDKISGMKHVHNESQQQLPLQSMQQTSSQDKQQHFQASTENHPTELLHQQRERMPITSIQDQSADEHNKMEQTKSVSELSLYERPSTAVSTTTLSEPSHVLPCKYLGHTTVMQATGAEAIESSLRDVLKSHKSQRAHLEFLSHALSLVTPRIREELYAIPVSDITQYMISKTSNRILSIITCDSNRIMYCHSIKFKKRSTCSEASHLISTSIVENSSRTNVNQPSTQAQSFARYLTTSSLQKDPAAPLGLFEAKYIGTVPVLKINGQETCEHAAMSLLQTNPTPSQVVLSVSSEGVKLVEATSSEVISSFPIKVITFTTTIIDKKVLKRDKSKGAKSEEALFAFIHHNARLERTTCELFRAGSRAKQICEAISVAFQMAVDRQRQQKSNPFTATSAKREPVKGPLFQRQIHRRHLHPLHVIGMGQFGEVYLAKQTVRQGDGENGGQTIHRAVKLLRNAASVNDRTEFLREAEVMYDMNHSNLLRLIGVAVQQRPWLCVLEYMEYGDLRSVVRVAKEKGLRLTFLEALKFIIQIATGMDYLSSHGYIHMDLAARNCLLGDKNLIKIADFGLTRKCKPGRDYYRQMTTLKLPVKWMAIESMEEKIFSTKSDVWAFGVTCWEIFSYGAVPYGKVKNAEIYQCVKEGLRLSCPPECPESFFILVISKCWITEWRDRPSFTDLRKYIFRFAHKVKETSPPLRDVGRALKVWNQEREEEQRKAEHAAKGSLDALQKTDLSKSITSITHKSTTLDSIDDEDVKGGNILGKTASNSSQTDDSGGTLCDDDGPSNGCGRNSIEVDPIQNHECMQLCFVDLSHASTGNFSGSDDKIEDSTYVNDDVDNDDGVPIEVAEIIQLHSSAEHDIKIKPSNVGTDFLEKNIGTGNIHSDDAYNFEATIEGQTSSLVHATSGLEDDTSA